MPDQQGLAVRQRESGGDLPVVHLQREGSLNRLGGQAECRDLPVGGVARLELLSLRRVRDGDERRLRERYPARRHQIHHLPDREPPADVHERGDRDHDGSPLVRHPGDVERDRNVVPSVQDRALVPDVDVDVDADAVSVDRRRQCGKRRERPRRELQAEPQPREQLQVGDPPSVVLAQEGALVRGVDQEEGHFTGRQPETARPPCEVRSPGGLEVALDPRGRAAPLVVQ
ncbi:hypothetical protein [Actinoallomurus iriomotensis]|uniref:hypothetical protein n=1 Tax=Actinoallomurus iriomotensis TaxID=478107 RepID=UPI002556B9C9|nr:hypothetical protein [Actinoallomurus iriomotensis]